MLTTSLWMGPPHRKLAPSLLAMDRNHRIDAPQRSILIVEDDPLMALALTDELEVQGYRVIAIADNAPEAVSIATQSEPDLIIADIRLNGPVDGVEAVRAIKLLIKTKIIFVTAHTDAEMRSRMNEVGFNAFIPKPYTTEQLLSAVSDAFRKSE